MGNLLSAIGRSQAIPQFIEQARQARKDESGLALEQEKMGLLRNQDRRAEIAAEGQNALTVEQLRIEKVKAQEAERIKSEGDKLVTISKAQENLPTKGMSNAMINDLRRRGHLIEEGVAEPSVTQRNLDAYAKRINTKSDAYDPVAAHEAAGGHLTSTRQYLDTMKQAASDPKIFKAMQEQLPDLKGIKFEEMQGVVKDAQAEYEAANNVFYQITEKQKLEIAEKERYQSERNATDRARAEADKARSESDRVRAEADKIRANATADKAGKIIPSVLNSAEHKRAQEIVDGWAEANKSKRTLDSEFLKQQGFEVKESEVDVPNSWTKGTHKEKTYDLVPIGDKQTPGAPAKTKDKFGYRMGETKVVNGKTYKYIGNNNWRY